jgi:hypothetical protein
MRRRPLEAAIAGQLRMNTGSAKNHRKRGFLSARCPGSSLESHAREPSGRLLLLTRIFEHDGHAQNEIRVTANAGNFKDTKLSQLQLT